MGNVNTRLEFEAILHESGIIQMLYAPSTLGTGPTPYHRGASATAGVESGTGAAGLQYSLDSAVLEAGLIVSFEPDGAGGYVMTGETNLVGTWIDVRATGSATYMAGGSMTFGLPWVFNYFGAAYGPGTGATTISVNTHGYVELAPSYWTDTTNTSLPNASEPPGMIACFWDLLPAGYWTYWQSVGVAPNRKLVIQYVDIGPTTTWQNFEIVLHETTNRIPRPGRATSSVPTEQGARRAPLRLRRRAGTVSPTPPRRRP